ncbi:MAG TPA: hypothetical protein VHW23_39360 [Kofleriaceae bacterium]|jgi:hypothetical protein|nr:hypothetical protein [Kofleriaceae bacterium]
MSPLLPPCIAALALAACGTTPSPRTPTMPEFALIFRPTHPVDPEALPRRNAAARDWAIALTRDGTLRTTSPLEDGGVVVSDRGTAQLARDHAVASVLIVEAASLEAAVALVQGHPGLAFGTEIEVRPVKAVAPPPR